MMRTILTLERQLNVANILLAIIASAEVARLVARMF